jgi:hypothetical protein
VREQMTLVLNDSMDRVGQTAVRWIPALATMLLVLLVAFLVAAVVRLLLRRALERLGFERRMRAWGVVSVGEWSPGRGPSAVVARVAFWLVVLVGFLVGLSAFETRPTETIAARVIDYLPNLAVAVVILVAGLAASRSAEQSVLIRAVNLQIRSARLLSLGARYLLLVLAAAMALHHLRIGGIILTISFTILFGGIVLALALAVGLGSHDVVRRSWERQMDEQRRVPKEEEELPHF